MDFSFLWSLLCLGVIVVIVLVSLMPWLFAAFFFSKKISDGMNKKEDEKRLLRENGGVVAPAVIISARIVMTVNEVVHIIDFEADVLPEGQPPFRAKFRGEINRRGIEIRRRQLVHELGQKIWVIYDPNDRSRVFLDRYNDEHEATIKFQEKEFRRLDFKRLLEENQQILEIGEEAQATIIKVEYLDVTYDGEEIKGLHTYLEVQPKTGLPFPAEAYGRVGINKLKKYTPGRTFFVKYDPRIPHRAVFDTEKNQSLPDVL